MALRLDISIKILHDHESLIGNALFLTSDRTTLSGNGVRMKTISDISESMLTGFRQQIADCVKTAQSALQAEIDSGKHITDNPVAVLDQRPLPYFGIEPPKDNEEDVWLYRTDRRIQRHRFVIGTSTYITARNAWKAYAPIEKALKELNWSDDEIFNVVTEIFPRGHHVYGILTLLFHRDEHGELFVLMGIRGKKLAVTNVGAASFPGGLVMPGEILPNATMRELREEGACGNIEIFPGYSVGPHNAAPSITFMRAGRTTTKEVKPCYEWEGKTVIWVPLSAVSSILFDGNNAPLIASFRSRGLNVEDSLIVAPDAVLPARILLEQFVL